MILHVPDYYKDFKCKADKCRNTCCQNWEIDIDENSLDIYKKAGGKFGDKIRDSIEYEETPHFKLDNNQKCPLLTENGLCSIYTELGEDKMCEICKLHPRFFEWFGNIKEGGVGLCCEEAAEIIINHKVGLTFEDIITDEKNEDEIDEVSLKMYNFLCSCRDILYSIIQDMNIKFEEKLSIILDFADKLQDNIDSCNYEIPDIKKCRKNLKINLLHIMERFNEFDFLEEKNKKRFEDNVKNYYQYENASKKLFEIDSNTEKYLLNIVQYFIMRYFIKGAYSDEILSSVRMAVTAAEYLQFEFTRIYPDDFKSGINGCIDAVCSFSSEIEYSEENISAFADMMYDEYFYKSEQQRF